MSGMFECVALILLNNRVLRPVTSKSGWGSRSECRASGAQSRLNNIPSPAGLG